MQLGEDIVFAFDRSDKSKQMLSSNKALKTSFNIVYEICFVGNVLETFFLGSTEDQWSKDNNQKL